jgi:hypothetical protein
VAHVTPAAMTATADIKRARLNNDERTAQPLYGQPLTNHADPE